MRTVVLSSTLRIVGFISLKSGTTVKCEEMPLASPAGPETAILTMAGRACPQRAGWLANAAESGDLARSRRAGLLYAKVCANREDFWDATGARTFLSAATPEYSTGSERPRALLPFDIAAHKNVRAPLWFR